MMGFGGSRWFAALTCQGEALLRVVAAVLPEGVGRPDQHLHGRPWLWALGGERLLAVDHINKLRVGVAGRAAAGQLHGGAGVGAGRDLRAGDGRLGRAVIGAWGWANEGSRGQNRKYSQTRVMYHGVQPTLSDTIHPCSCV